MLRRSFDLLLIILLVIAASVLALTQSPFLWLRVPLGLLLTLVLPGYLLASLLFPRASFTIFERLALIGGLSLSFAAVGGLVLYWITGNLSAGTWVLFLGGATIIGAAILFFRRIILDRGQTGAQPGSTIPARDRFPITSQWLYFTLALGIVAGAFLSARSIASQQPQTDVVQMWMIPDQKNPAHAIDLGVITKTSSPHQFSVVLKHGNVILQQWPDLKMSPDDQWQAVVNLPNPFSGAGPLDAYLIDLNNPSVVYRHVSLWPEASTNP